jgi:hypothetical protein
MPDLLPRSTMSAVRVFVSSPDTRSERRFELSTTIGALKVGLPAR